jgi:hypothetical protein
MVIFVPPKVEPEAGSMLVIVGDDTARAVPLKVSAADARIKTEQADRILLIFIILI